VKPVPFRSEGEVEAALDSVSAHLRAGGLIAYPTETVYGLGSRARATEVQALQQLKGRRPDKPFLLLVSDRGMAEAQGLAFNPSASALARVFWPGPLPPGRPGVSGPGSRGDRTGLRRRGQGGDAAGAGRRGAGELSPLHDR